jgi:DNA-binding IscR family transcriptional regulator
MHDLWTEARAKMNDTLRKTSLADLREKYQHDFVTRDK